MNEKSACTLIELARIGAEKWPDRCAVVDDFEKFSYRELNFAADAFATSLLDRGVAIGDRVALWVPRSSLAIVAMQGILRAGAVYVPISNDVPLSKGLAMLENCAVSALIAEPERLATVLSTFPGLIGIAWNARRQGEFFANQIDPFVGQGPPALTVSPSDAAYILYTSGSTGAPKGVVHCHSSALAFIGWAAELLDVQPEDVFANHAPFHTGLAVHDIYVPWTRGAQTAVIGESLALSPKGLVDFIRHHRVNRWYSVPSALILMMRHGSFLAKDGFSLKSISFAGEVFPIQPLRELHAAFVGTRIFNFYGATETNVTVFYEIVNIAPDWSRPVPIGDSASGARLSLRTDNGDDSAAELVVDGPSVMIGYWGREPVQGHYATGDLARRLPEGPIECLGRRDHRVKYKGHRVELSEIEVVLSQSEAIQEVAVLLLGVSGIEAKLIAFGTIRPGKSPPSLLDLKRICKDHLPQYMIIHDFRVLADFPRNASGKIDRFRLAAD